MNQLLAPGVEDGEEADLGTEVFGIGGDGAECGGRGLEQQVVNHRLVLQGQAGHSLGQGEDDVKIDDRQELLLTGSDPAGLGQGLALGAVAIATGVVGRAQEAAGGGTATEIVRWSIITGGFALAIAAAFGAMSQARGLSAAVEGIARNPSAAGEIRGNLILGLVLIESLVIYVLLISLILFFIQPFAA